MSNPFVCVRNDDADGLRALLSTNSPLLNIRFRDTDATILHEAAKGSIGCLRALIEHGANVNAATWAGRAAGRNSAAFSRAINKLGETPLHWACDASCAEALCKAGANHDALDVDGLTPLDYALRRNQRRVVMTLLRVGAKLPVFSCESHQDAIEKAEKASASWKLARAVERAGDWAAYVAQHKGVLAGLVTKCKPMPADAAGLVVEFMCPPGGF